MHLFKNGDTLSLEWGQGTFCTRPALALPTHVLQMQSENSIAL